MTPPPLTRLITIPPYLQTYTYTGRAPCPSFRDRRVPTAVTRATPHPRTPAAAKLLTRRLKRAKSPPEGLVLWRRNWNPCYITGGRERVRRSERGIIHVSSSQLSSPNSYRKLPREDQSGAGGMPQYPCLPQTVLERVLPVIKQCLTHTELLSISS